MKTQSLMCAGLGMFTSLCLCGLFAFKFPGEAPFKIPVIVNQGAKSQGCLSPQYMLNAWYHIERVEQFGDTLDMALKSKPKRDQYLPQFTEPKNETGSFSNHGLVLIVDTLNELSMVKRPIWASYLFHRHFSDNKILLQDDTLIKEVQSFGIFLANESPTKTAQVRTQDGSLIMVLEARDGKKWKQTEYWSGSWCGNSYFTLALKPKHYLFTRGIKCSGEHKTLCRLKLTTEKEHIYSNSFYMSVNKSQFEEPRR